jgi:mono/diheme cytochrome c family protein
MNFFNKLISALKYYGIVYFIFLGIIVVLGAIYLNKLSFMVATRDIPPAPKDTTRVQADLPYAKGEQLPPVDITTIGKPTQEMLDKGKTQYTNMCSSCHGMEGKGDGPGGAALNPKPRNFTDLNGWKNGPKFSQMYKTLAEGIPNTGMASFNYLPPSDRISIIDYIRTLNPGYPPVTEPEIAEMDKTYSLSQGFKKPNQIPVSVALEKTLQEYDTLRLRIATIEKTIISDTKDTGAIVFRRIAKEVDRAVIVLAKDTAWIRNANEFVSLIQTNPLNNGFRTTVYDLSDGEVNTVYLYLKRLFERARS